MGTVVGFLLSTLFPAVSPKQFPLSLAFDTILVLIFLSLFVLMLMVRQLSQHTEDLRTRVGMKTRYIEIGQRDADQSTVYRAARDAVLSATTSIFAVESSSGADEGLSEPANEDTVGYFAALLEQAAQGVKYVRVFQLRHDETIHQYVRSRGTVANRHYHSMVTMRDDEGNGGRSKIGLFTSPARRPTTFVLIDEKLLLWQVDELLASGERRMHGIFIFDDPAGDMTRQFMDFFESLHHSKNVRSVHDDDLPPLPR